MIIYPGTIGLLESRDHGHSQGTASASGNQHEVEGSQCVWKITYPEQGAISYAESVVPLCCCSGLSSAGFGLTIALVFIALVSIVDNLEFVLPKKDATLVVS